MILCWNQFENTFDDDNNIGGINKEFPNVTNYCIFKKRSLLEPK